MEPTSQIPPRLLEHPEFRYIITNPDGKSITLKQWPTKFSYHAGHFMIQNAIKVGRNIGIVGGFGGLIIIDIDNAEAAEKLVAALPSTYMHRSAGRGLPHLFYIVDAPVKLRIRHPDGKTKIADVRTFGGMVVVPPSRNVETGRPYTVANDVPITHTTMEDLRKAVQQAGFSSESNLHTGKRVVASGNYGSLFSVVGKIKKLGGSEYIGAHPVHGSRTGSNLAFDTSTGLWYCFRCECGGGSYAFSLMIQNNLSCDEATRLAKENWRNRHGGRK